MDILFVAGFSPIVADPDTGRSFYRDALGLPFDIVSGDYIAMDGFEGTKHLGIWPLADDAGSCFGTREWPDEVPVPQATIEFEVANGHHERRTTGDGGHGFGNGKRHARSEDPGYRCRPDHVLKLRQCPEPGGAPGRPSHYGCQPDLPATASSTTSYNRPARAFPVGESASTTR